MNLTTAIVMELFIVFPKMEPRILAENISYKMSTKSYIKLLDELNVMLSKVLNNRFSEQPIGNLPIEMSEKCFKELAEFNKQLLENPIKIEPATVLRELSVIPSSQRSIELQSRLEDGFQREAPIDSSNLDEYEEETLDEYSDDYLDESSDEYLDSLIEEFTESTDELD